MRYRVIWTLADGSTVPDMHQWCSEDFAMLYAVTVKGPGDRVAISFSIESVA
jgi:hypothetical protein